MSEWPRKGDESHVDRWPSQWMLRNALGEISQLGDGPVESLDARYDQALYVPASELERVSVKADQAELVAQGACEELERAEAKLAEVRAEVEKAEANAQLGNGGELEDPLANIKSILDSSPSLSGGCESSGVRDRVQPALDVALELAERVNQELNDYPAYSSAADAIHDAEAALENRSGAETELRDQLDLLVRAAAPIQSDVEADEEQLDTFSEVFQDSCRLLARIQVEEERTSLSGDVEERGEEGEQRACESCGRPGAFHKPGDDVEWLCGFATGCHPNATQQSSTTGNSLSGEPIIEELLKRVKQAEDDAELGNGGGLEEDTRAAGLREAIKVVRSLSVEPGDCEPGREHLLKVAENPETNERRYRCTACNAEFMSPLDDAPLPTERECDGCHRYLRTDLTQPKDGHLSLHESDDDDPCRCGRSRGRHPDGGPCIDGGCEGFVLDTHLSGDEERMEEIARVLEEEASWEGELSIQKKRRDQAAFLRDLATRLSEGGQERVEGELEDLIRRAYCKPIKPPVEGENPETVDSMAAAALVSDPDRMRHLVGIQTAVIRAVRKLIAWDTRLSMEGGEEGLREQLEDERDAREHNQQQRWAAEGRLEGLRERLLSDETRQKIEQIAADHHDISRGVLALLDAEIAAFATTQKSQDEGDGADCKPPCDESCKSRCRGSGRVCDDHHDRRLKCPGCPDCKPQDEGER